MNLRFVVDSSALISILNQESDAADFLDAVNAGRPVIGAPTLFESRIWCLRRSRPDSLEWLDDWAAGADVISFDRRLEREAAQAYRRFGKGLHPASLNYGDAMCYAVAAQHDAPLLFKGSDFGRTDVRVHPASIVLN